MTTPHIPNPTPPNPGPVNGQLHTNFKELAMSEFRKLGLDDKLDVIYETQIALFEYVRDLEKKASDMTNPDKMAEMMQGMFSGGGFFS